MTTLPPSVPTRRRSPEGDDRRGRCARADRISAVADVVLRAHPHPVDHVPAVRPVMMNSVEEPVRLSEDWTQEVNRVAAGGAGPVGDR